MNSTFKVVFNKARGALMVANEVTSSVQAKGTKTVLAVALAATFAVSANAAQILPSAVGGTLIATNIDSNFTNLNNEVLANFEKVEDLNKLLFTEGTGVLPNLEAANNQLGQKVEDLNKLLFTEGTGILPNLEAADAQLNQKIETTASNLQGKIDTNKANIDKVNEKADLANRANDVQNKQIAGLQSANLAQDKLIATNKAAIAANKADIVANRTLIQEYKTYSEGQFKAVNSRIDSLDEKMKKGFASQAALNGLFQPYNVGKFNMSVAIGGFDSEQAMAFGSGYRFNENFALKAGIASDLSGFDHVTYNIGANFEF